MLLPPFAEGALKKRHRHSPPEFNGLSSAESRNIAEDSTVAAVRCNRRNGVDSALYIGMYGHMDTMGTIETLAALSQATRLDAFRLLVTHEPDGLPAGEIARLLDVPHNTMSTHLAVLSRAGLVRFERQSRSIIYRADLERIREVITYLLKDCCAGRPELCAPLVAELTPCCAPKPKEKRRVRSRL